MVKLIIGLILISGAVHHVQPDINETLKRRSEKALLSVCKSGNFSYQPIAKNEEAELFRLFSDSVFAGYLTFTNSMGRAEKFDYIILYNAEIEVVLVSIINYHSTRGTGVTSKRWLRQFNGNKGEDLTYGRDVQAISGATYSATSLTNDIPMVTRWVKSVANDD
jgi:hypothetical protein